MTGPFAGFSIPGSRGRMHRTPDCGPPGVCRTPDEVHLCLRPYAGSGTRNAPAGRSHAGAWALRLRLP